MDPNCQRIDMNADFDGVFGIIQPFFVYVKNSLPLGLPSFHCSREDSMRTWTVRLLMGCCVYKTINCLIRPIITCSNSLCLLFKVEKSPNADKIRITVTHAHFAFGPSTRTCELIKSLHEFLNADQIATLTLITRLHMTRKPKLINCPPIVIKA